MINFLNFLKTFIAVELRISRISGTFGGKSVDSVVILIISWAIFSDFR